MREETRAIRVAVVDDRPELRDALATLLGQAEGFAMTGAYRSMEEALPALTRSAAPPDVALIDLGLPGMSGLEGIKLLRAQRPALLLVVLTVHDDDERVFDALCAGASGYLLKGLRPDRLLEGIREVHRGGSPISPEIARRVIALFRDIRPAAPAPDHKLTPHETRVLKLLVEGHSYKTAADRLRVSVNTVSFHMRRIYEKLEVHSKSEAVAKALRHRIVD